MTERYIQLFNAANQPFFVGMETGKASWVIPVKKISQLTYMAHLTDESKCYYEELSTQEVSWKLPFTQMTPAAANTCKVLPGCNEEDTAEWIDEDFPEEKSIELMFAIDAYLLEGDQGDQEEQDEEEIPAVESTPNTGTQSPGLVGSMFSPGSSSLFEKQKQTKAQNDSENESENESDGEKDNEVPDFLAEQGVKNVEEYGGSEDGSDSGGSGGTAETDEDFYAKKFPQEAKGSSESSSILTAASILGQNTVKVMLHIQEF